MARAEFCLSGIGLKGPKNLGEGPMQQATARDMGTFDWHADARLEGHSGEAPQAHELAEVDCDGHGARQEQVAERGHGVLVRQNPSLADPQVHEGAQRQQHDALLSQHATCMSAAVDPRYQYI
jgi:hypothetical protein